MDTDTKRDLWDLLESPPDRAKHTAGLCNWSMNFEFGQRPWELFLDLIGWSEENYGAPMFQNGVSMSGFGYMELDYLGDALKEYADAPYEVTRFVDLVMSAEEA